MKGLKCHAKKLGPPVGPRANKEVYSGDLLGGALCKTDLTVRRCWTD